MRRLAVWSLALLLAATTPALAEVSELRMTPVVRAVQSASPAVVNIQGQKLVAPRAGAADGQRPVNGMGTGVVIDPRGYILTNHHVVDGVKQINVTLGDRRAYTARLVAHDRRTDLAVIKIRTGNQLPTIPIGTSSDLMTGESVIAVGNAYGYEHTVTRGIISALHRDVQVSETQSYEDLIQTDASINPGNSGGPLLSIEGRMVGLNVAVRAGAQGIGFAIPVDMALEVAARIMSIERLERKWHGLQTEASPESGELVVRRVMGGSPAQQSGLKPGDVIMQIGDTSAAWPLDVELAMLGRKTGSRVPVLVQRDAEQLELTLAVAPRGKRVASSNNRSTKPSSTTKNATASNTKPKDAIWQVLGMQLKPEPRSTFSRRKTRYRGGMRIVRVRSNGPAAQQGIVAGDILVGMHRWETASEQDLRYIVSRSNNSSTGPMKFYLLRGDETLYGHISLAKSSRRTTKR